MSADGLQRALLALGVECRIEARDKLAVVHPTVRGTAFDDPTIRRAALALLPQHGFTHLALEIPEAPAGDAAVSGD